MAISFELLGLPVKLEHTFFAEKEKAYAVDKAHIKVGYGSLQIGELARVNLNIFRNQETQELWAIVPSSKVRGKFVAHTYIPKEQMEIVNAKLNGNTEDVQEQPEEEVWMG